MALNITFLISKFVWKNKIIIPCILFTVSFIMLVRIFRHNVEDSTKQPVEYLETIDIPDEQERKLGRNQLSLNQMEKMDKNWVLKDIYKDFKDKGKEFEGQGFERVKGEGEVEVVQGYEREAWVGRTYDPLSLLKDQTMEVIDLETIDDYVIKGPDVNKFEYSKFNYDQVASRKNWHGSFKIKAKKIETVYNTPEKRQTTVAHHYTADRENEAKVIKDRTVPSSSNGYKIDKFQNTPVLNYEKGKLQSHILKSQLLDVTPVTREPAVQRYQDEVNDIPKERFPVRMGKKKKKRKKQKRVSNPDDRNVFIENNVIIKKKPASPEFQINGNENVATDLSKDLQYKSYGAQRHTMIPRKDSLLLHSIIAQNLPSNNALNYNKQDHFIKSIRRTDTSALKYEQGISDINKPNNEQGNTFYSSKNQNNDQYKSLRRRQTYPQQHVQVYNQRQVVPAEISLQNQQPSLLHAKQMPVNHNNISPNGHPPLLNENQRLLYPSTNVPVAINITKKRYSGQQLMKQRPLIYNQQQPLVSHTQQYLNSQGKANTYQQIQNTWQNPDESYVQRKQTPVQTQNNVSALQYQQSANLHPPNYNNLPKDRPSYQPLPKYLGHQFSNRTVPDASFVRVLTQQNFLKDVQREISQQYTYIRQLQARLEKANSGLQNIVPKPQVSSQKRSILSNNTPQKQNLSDTKYHTLIREYSQRNVPNVQNVFQNAQQSKVIKHEELGRQYGNYPGKGGIQNPRVSLHVKGDHGIGDGGTKLNEHASYKQIPHLNREQTDDKPYTGGFKLKHRRKPTNLQKTNQTRIYAFESNFNDSIIPGNNASVCNSSLQVAAVGIDNNSCNNSILNANSTLDLVGIRQKLKKLSKLSKSAGLRVKHLSKTLYRNLSVPLELFNQWMTSRVTYCHDNNFEGYDDKFVHLRNVVIDRKFSMGKVGGENISEVINQLESSEYYKVYPGFFQLYCEANLHGDRFIGNHHINEWIHAIEATQDVGDSRLVTDFTVAVVRYEYANLYHTMTDFYNVFLMMEFFNKTQSETNVLLIDGHPNSNLDQTWFTLFNSTNRVANLSVRTRFTDLVWNIVGYESVMNDHYMMQLPLVEEFRHFFLSSFGVNKKRTLNCDSVSILFIWRRDYVAHPRNPSGSIQRKVENEKELITQLRKKFANFTIRGVQIDLFEMKQQLEFITETDILIGMHGAGLTHSMFLPKHAGIIELIPNYWSAANMHFEAIATWRNLYFDRWTNEDPRNEVPNYATKIPPEVAITLVKNMLRSICNSSIDQTTYHGPGSNNNNKDSTQIFKYWNNE